jgi:hypothetical protein
MTATGARSDGLSTGTSSPPRAKRRPAMTWSAETGMPFGSKVSVIGAAELMKPLIG